AGDDDRPDPRRHGAVRGGEVPDLRAVPAGGRRRPGRAHGYLAGGAAGDRCPRPPATRPPDQGRMSDRPELVSGASFRAIVTGMIIGGLLTPCNVYSGLKIGWSFNMSITAALLSFAFWRLAEDLAGTRPWHLQENVVNQTAASSAASI